MLTHHQYTYIQKERNPADGMHRNSGVENSSGKTPTIDGDHKLFGSSGYLRVRVYCHQRPEFVRGVYQGVEENHRRGNLMFRVSRSEVGLASGDVFERRAAKSGLEMSNRLELVADSQSASSSDSNSSEAGAQPDSLQAIESRLSLEDKIKRARKSEEFRIFWKGIPHIDWGATTDNQFLAWTTECLVSSTALQFYYAETPAPASLINLLVKNARRLLVSKFGCHIIKALLSKSDQLFDRLSLLVLGSFEAMCSDQFASKVVQSMAERKSAFGELCIEKICECWDRIYTYISTNYLLSFCLQNTPVDSNQFKLVGQCLLERIDTLSRNKYNKRFLVSYLEACPHSQLNTFFKALRFEQLFHRRCRDKYMLRVFATLLRRAHGRSEKLLISLVNNSLDSLLALKLTRNLIATIIGDPAYRVSRRIRTLLFKKKSSLLLYPELSSIIGERPDVLPDGQ